MAIKQSTIETINALLLASAGVMYVLNLVYLVISFFSMAEATIIMMVSLLGLLFPPLGAIMGLYHLMEFTHLWTIGELGAEK